MDLHPLSMHTLISKRDLNAGLALVGCTSDTPLVNRGRSFSSQSFAENVAQRFLDNRCADVTPERIAS